MAFADPIIVADHAAANQNFTGRSSMQGGSDWIEDDATLTDQRQLSIRHSNAGPSVLKGQTPIRRHLVQFQHVKYDSTIGKNVKMVLNTTLTIDPGAGFTTLEQQNLVAFTKNFFTDANLAKLIRDET
jgi:hypothetical protein